MAEPLSSYQDSSNPQAQEERVVMITNKHGEKLVGLLQHMGSNKIVVLCHGFTASKNDSIIVDLANALTKQGVGIFRFDFSGNGESEGEFQYGNYRKEADDLHSVVSHLKQEKYDVKAIVGHSKVTDPKTSFYPGGDVVVLYASIYDDVSMVVNLSGRFHLERGIEERLGKEFMDIIEKEGYIDVKTKSVHGSADDIIPVEDAYEFAKHIPNHKLNVIDGADHCYTAHRKELSDAVVDFITSSEVCADANCSPIVPFRH
uniref:Serine aminopeptidase S33 domain-containing protein n=1 Tax=Leersia perrieri TaxID=77586 RepID=A0A0D9V291_9ORYZ